MNKSIRQMLSLILCLLLCAGLLPGRVWAAEIVDSGTCGDNLTWTLDSEGTLTISGTGEMEDYDWNSFPWYEKRSSIHTVEIRSGVTSIGDWAFNDCSSLTSVTIPNSVTSIGDDAFYYCDSLTNVTIPDSVTSIGYCAFYYCDSLTNVTIPDSVTSIGDCAFSYCDSLTSVTIPDSVTSIGDWAFAFCTSLTGFSVSPENPVYCDIDGILFSKDHTVLFQFPAGKGGGYSIPNSVTSIGVLAFGGCDSLTSVTIPDSVTSIGEAAFENCSRLTSVTIPNSVTSIGGGAFSFCHSLTSVTIPDSVTSIEGSTFSYCSSLTSVTIPNSVTSIGYAAFSYCRSLTSVTIPNSVTFIDDYAFSDCSSLTDVYYSGTKAQWNAIIGSGKPTGNMITIHYFDADPSNPLGQSQPYIVGEGDKAAAVVNIASPADRPMTVYGVRYSAAGQLLGIDAYTLEAGQSGQLDIPFENGDYLRIFAMDADTCAPLCKNLQVDRPA